MNFSEIVNHRRSVRHYDESQNIESDIVRECIELATHAPNSSNMQLWEFYHVTDPEKLKKLSHYCLDQQAASTAKEMVVFVTRQELFRNHAKKMLKLETENVLKNSPQNRHEHRIKRWKLYYGTVMPFLYARFLGIFGLIRKLLMNLVWIFRPTTLQVSESDSRIVVHKTCALAAQTFMLAMAEKGYDTCPMEGIDSRRIKNMLKLPFGAEINMVISCGIRTQSGVWGDRMRLPFEEVYHRV